MVTVGQVQNLKFAHNLTLLLELKSRHLHELCSLGARTGPPWAWPCWQPFSSQKRVDELHAKERKHSERREQESF